jgi:fatty acid synthase, animal type
MSQSKFAKNNFSDAGDQIVISGMAGRFPNARNVIELKEKLFSKVDMIDDAETRWRHLDPELPKRFGKISDLDKFDASFFSVNNRQANLMDPQGRMILEHAYEAVLDAGINPKSLCKSNTGVFVACCTSDNEKLDPFGLTRKSLNLSR